MRQVTLISHTVFFPILWFWRRHRNWRQASGRASGDRTVIDGGAAACSLRRFFVQFSLRTYKAWNPQQPCKHSHAAWSRSQSAPLTCLNDRWALPTNSILKASLGTLRMSLKPPASTQICYSWIRLSAPCAWSSHVLSPSAELRSVSWANPPLEISHCLWLSAPLQPCTR